MSQPKRSAADPWLLGRAPHVPFGPGALPPVALLPGDPARVDLAASAFADFSIIGQNREFRLGIGTFAGQQVAVCSTGIGGPSTEIAVVELQRLGVRTFLRIGGMGAVNAGIAPGTITHVASAVRDSSAARFYVPGSDPLASSARVNEALRNAAKRLEIDLPAISVMSCDSYYVGEGRPLSGLQDAAHERYQTVLESGADGMDMETETVFAVAQALNCDFGALLIAHGNRATDAWLEDYEPAQRNMLKIAVAAAAELGRHG